jgi:hypothetical protein
MTSKIEIARKKAPPKIDVLARQIEALKNDTTAEKLKTVEPRLSHLSEKIKILKNSRKAHAQKAIEIDEKEAVIAINEKFEKILEELEVENFFERFEAAEKIIDFLKTNPERKLSDLQATDLPEITILQNPKEWINILADVKKDLAIRKILTDEKFDWKNPKAYLEKSGSIGKEIIEISKKNPVLASVCVLGGIYALYQFIGKKGVWSKIRGTLIGGGTALLGLSLFGGINFKNEYRKWFLEGMVDKDDQKTAMGIVGSAKEKLDDTLGLNEKDLDKYGLETQKGIEKIQKRKEYENIALYKIMRHYAKNGGGAIDKKYVLEDCKRLENGGGLSSKKRTEYLTIILGANSTVKISGKFVELIPDFVKSAATAGGYLAYKISIEELKFCKNLTKYLFRRDIENTAELWGQWGKNAIIVFGVSTARDYLAKENTLNFLLKKVPKNFAKSALWPVYIANIAGESISGAAKVLGHKKLLGHWKSTKKVFEFVEKGGRTIAKFNPTDGALKIWEGGKWVMKKMPGKEIARKTATSIAKKTVKGTKEVLKKSVKNKFYLGAVRQKLAAALKKVKVPKEALRQVLKLLPKPVQVAAVGAASLGSAAVTAILWDALFPEEAGAANEVELIKKSTILHQMFSEQGLPIEYAWWVNRKDSRKELSKLPISEKQKIITAIHAANAKIEKELPGTPLFEIPAELRKPPSAPPKSSPSGMEQEAAKYIQAYSKKK